MIDLNTTWYLLVGVLLAGYAVLDGFDLGVGVLHLLTRGERERRILMNAIGPVWDGNEVWLLTGGGAIFAAFPAVYATAFSSFYLALVLLLLALIGRAVSFEFRSKVAAPGWRRAWDLSFGLGSLLPAVLFGVASGNVLRGLPLDADGTFRGTFLGLLNPYALLVGLITLALFTFHGAAYLAVKTEGELQARMRRSALWAWAALLVLYSAGAAATRIVSPHLFSGLAGRPLFWLFLLLLVAGLAFFPRAVLSRRDRLAFACSTASVAAVCGLAGLSLYPRLLPSRLDPGFSLTAYNASSSPLTLKVMLIIALLGVPLVLAYTAWIYRTFKGKVVLTEESY